MKRILALLFALLIGISVTSCGKNDDVPDGMQAAYREGEPFRLYVPEQWKINEGSGYSGAVYYGPDEVIVTARYYTPSDRDLTVDAYLTACAEGYAVTLNDYETKSIDAAVLGGADARRLSFTMTIGKLAYTGYQICTDHNGDMISLQMYLPTDYVEQLSEAINSITTSFVLCDKAEPKNDEYVDKKTPEGMKIATHDEMEYRLYVPKAWICDSQSDKSEAYYPESGKSNVTVTSYSPAEAMTAEEHWEVCRKEYEKSLSGFALIGTEPMSVAGKDAVSATYEAAYDGVTFRIRQVCFVYRDMVYTLTYTALTDNYDLHLQDVDRMLSEFHFR